MSIDFSKAKRVERPGPSVQATPENDTVLMNVFYPLARHTDLKVHVKKRRATIKDFFLLHIQAYIKADKDIREFEIKKKDLKQTTIQVPGELKEKMNSYVREKGKTLTDLFITIVDDSL